MSIERAANSGKDEHLYGSVERHASPSKGGAAAEVSADDPHKTEKLVQAGRDEPVGEATE